jgi:hypothetical protein
VNKRNDPVWSAEDMDRYLEEIERADNWLTVIFGVIAATGLGFALYLLAAMVWP